MLTTIVDTSIFFEVLEEKVDEVSTKCLKTLQVMEYKHE